MDWIQQEREATQLLLGCLRCLDGLEAWMRTVYIVHQRSGLINLDLNFENCIIHHSRSVPNSQTRKKPVVVLLDWESATDSFPYRGCPSATDFEYSTCRGLLGTLSVLPTHDIGCEVLIIRSSSGDKSELQLILHYR